MPGFFSVKHRGKVIERSNNIWCPQVEFIVQKSGSTRAKTSKQRNVHAFVVTSEYHTCYPLSSVTEIREITYRPFVDDTFTYKDTNQPVKTTSNVLCSNGKLFEIQ